MKQHIQRELSEAQRMLETLAADSQIADTVERIALQCVEALRKGNKILIAGNGGSAADAQHMAAELVGRFKFDRPALAAIALTADSSVVTALGNDCGYEQVFARQVQALGVRGDILIAFSTSGRSPNILLALEEGRKLGLVTFGFAGQSGGAMPPLCRDSLLVPSTDTARIQEGHAVLIHIICGLIESTMFGRG